MNITDISTRDQAAKLSNFSRSKNLIAIPYVHTTAAAQKTHSRTIEIKCTMGNQARPPVAAHRSSAAAGGAQSPVALEQRPQLLAIDTESLWSGHVTYELSARANSSARANRFSVAVSLLKTCSSDFWPVCSSSCGTVPSATIDPW